VIAACGGKADHQNAPKEEPAGSGGLASGGASSGGASGGGASGGTARAGAGAVGNSAGVGGSGGSDGSSGGSGGSSEHGGAGVPSAGRGGRSGSGGQSAGGSGGAPAAGAGGQSGSAGKAAGGSGNSGPATLAQPSMNQTWHYTSGDPLNSTPPVLLAVDEDIVLAGASADPQTVGVMAFDSGVTSEAFVMRMSQGKALWSKPLTDAGLPWAIARSGDDVVIVAPYLPGSTEVSTSSVGESVYIGKFGLDGTTKYETSLPFTNAWTAAYGMAVDASGSIYLAGSYGDSMTGAENIIVVKCDTNGNQVWSKQFPHPGNQALAFAVTVLTSGDIVVTGDFDTSQSFDGDKTTLMATATTMGLPSGFIARFTPDGDAVWSAEFGGTDFAVGEALAPLADGGFLLAGSDSLDIDLGGLTAKGASFTPSDTQTFPPTAAFIARLDGDGKASWLKLEQQSPFAYAVATDGSGTAFLGTSGTMTSDTYLRTYDLATGKVVQVLSGNGDSNIQTSSLAVATSGALWISGIYSNSSADFGNADVLEASPAGVFFLEVAPQ
jgi:hypothetical protein